MNNDEMTPLENLEDLLENADDWSRGELTDGLDKAINIIREQQERIVYLQNAQASTYRDKELAERQRDAALGALEHIARRVEGNCFRIYAKKALTRIREMK